MPDDIEQPAPVGHNGLAQTGLTISPESARIFKDIIKRLEATQVAKDELKEEGKLLSEDERNIYSEAKGLGFEKGVIKEVLHLLHLERKGKLDNHMEDKAKLHLYLELLGRGHLAPTASDE